jgi:hypothetical protein
LSRLKYKQDDILQINVEQAEHLDSDEFKFEAWIARTKDGNIDEVLSLDIEVWDIDGTREADEYFCSGTPQE